MIIIDPKNIALIRQLKKDQIAFPDIYYNDYLELNLNSTTIKGAYSTISKRVDQIYFTDLEWDENGDIVWQNKMLAELSKKIFIMIANYQKEQNDQLLLKIFIWIQLWGGNAGRSIFIRGQGWPGNFELQKYKAAINFILSKQYMDGLKILNTLFGLNTAFSTKHIHFWSDRAAPIYDSLIAAIIFGRNKNQVRHNEYSLYMDSLDTLINKLGGNGITRSSIERSLFNWANTEDGIEWRKLRLFA